MKQQKMLFIDKGFCLDTPTGKQKIIRQYGSTCYIVHNYDKNGVYRFASYVTDREILQKYYDMTGKKYNCVWFCT